jgi:hypothetical protein
MLYSALTAPTLWGNFFFTLPHFVIGGVLVEATWRRKCWLRGVSDGVGLMFQGLVGGVLFLIPACGMVKSTLDTLGCRSALEHGDVSIVSGVLTIDKKIYKPGAGHIDFSIGGYAFKTGIEGRSCDCGYIASIGSKISRAANMAVKAEVKDGVILRLETVQ